MPCWRINRKWTYISTMINAGRMKTWMAKNLCRVPGPTTDPPWSSALVQPPMSMGPIAGGLHATCMVTEVAQ